MELNPRSRDRCTRYSLSQTVGALAVVLFVIYPPYSAYAQAKRYLNPRDIGLDIPPGPVTRGDGERVTTVDQAGDGVVGKVLVNVGEHRIVVLPDGELVARSKSSSPLTERRFTPMSREDVISQMSETFGLGFKTKKTRRYVYVYNTSENFALVTSRILESMLPGVKNYARSLGIQANDPDVPLVAIMFRTKQQFQRFRPMPDGVVAYYNTLTNHVVMYEQSELWRVKPELAIQQSISTIAHEGAHQILHNVGVQNRLSAWPMWLSEGLAEYLAPTTFGRRLKWKGAGQVNDMRMFELEVYIKGRTASATDGELIDQTVSAARLTSTGYATAWSLTHFLARSRKSDFAQYVREVSQTGPLEIAGDIVSPGIILQNKQVFQKYFDDDFASLEKKLVDHLERLPYRDPFLEWPHYVATVSAPNGRRSIREANVFHSPELANNWARQVIREFTDEQQAGAVARIAPFPNRVAAQQFINSWLSGRSR